MKIFSDNQVSDIFETILKWSLLKMFKNNSIVFNEWPKIWTPFQYWATF